VRLIKDGEVMCWTRVACAHKCIILKEIGVDGGDEIVAFECEGDRVERFFGARQAV
jgi:hypothetical protein